MSNNPRYKINGSKVEFNYNFEVEDSDSMFVNAMNKVLSENLGNQESIDALKSIKGDAPKSQHQPPNLLPMGDKERVEDYEVCDEEDLDSLGLGKGVSCDDCKDKECGEDCSCDCHVADEDYEGNEEPMTEDQLEKKMEDVFNRMFDKAMAEHQDKYEMGSDVALKDLVSKTEEDQEEVNEKALPKFDKKAHSDVVQSIEDATAKIEEIIEDEEEDDCDENGEYIEDKLARTYKESATEGDREAVLEDDPEALGDIPEDAVDEDGEHIEDAQARKYRGWVKKQEGVTTKEPKEGVVKEDKAPKTSKAQSNRDLMDAYFKAYQNDPTNPNYFQY